jgi:hypothetical protein
MARTGASNTRERPLIGDDAEEPPRARKKPRKQRPYYSCDGELVASIPGIGTDGDCPECRRLKMKCDRVGEDWMSFVILMS